MIYEIFLNDSMQTLVVSSSIMQTDYKTQEKRNTF